jgi:hypothetical protein
VRCRLAAVDLDGTLLRSDLTLSDRTRAAIGAARDAGVEVVVVTARSPRSARTVARDAGIVGRAVCANGATVYDLDSEEIVRHTPLDAVTVTRIVQAWRTRRPTISFGWELELRFGSEPAYERHRDARRWPRPDDSFPPVDAARWGRPVTKLLARDPGADLDTLLREASALAGRACTVTTAGDAFVELMAPGVSKHAALVVLAAERGIEPREIVAFGDQRTDAGMLAWAGLGVAVANAHPEALAAADLVTATNDDDGVAIVLEEMLARGR